MREATKAVLIRFTPEELAAIDRLRAPMARGSWIKALCRDAVRARDAFGRACGLRVVATVPGGAVLDAPARPEPVALAPDAARDGRVSAVTGHPVQPCRCPACVAERERLA